MTRRNIGKLATAAACGVLGFGLLAELMKGNIDGSFAQAAAGVAIALLMGAVVKFGAASMEGK